MSMTIKKKKRERKLRGRVFLSVSKNSALRKHDTNVVFPADPPLCKRSTFCLLVFIYLPQPLASPSSPPPRPPPQLPTYPFSLTPASDPHLPHVSLFSLFCTP